MKIVRSFLLVIVLVCTANLLQAQELKAEVKKQSTTKPLTPAAAASKPAPAVKPAKSTAPDIIPVKPAGPIQDVPQDPNNVMPQPGVLKKHHR